MKTINIRQAFPEDWIRVLHNIANLFYEDTTIVHGDAEADIVFDLAYEQLDNFEVKTSATMTVDGQTFTNAYSKQYDEVGTDKEQRIRLKRALSHVMLDCLEQYTGVTQEWGILTGVRPTKLFHKYRKAGMPEAEIFATLQADYRISDGKIELMKEIVERQLKTIPDLDTIGREISVYIGIPFCPTKCVTCIVKNACYWKKDEWNIETRMLPVFCTWKQTIAVFNPDLLW